MGRHAYNDEIEDDSEYHRENSKRRDKFDRRRPKDSVRSFEEYANERQPPRKR